MPVACYFPNPIDTSDRVTHVIDSGANLLQFMQENGYTVKMRQQPLLVLVNGVELTESQYDRVLNDGDTIALTIQLEEAATIFYIVYAVLIVALYLTMPEPYIPGDTEEGSPTYNINARGNRARLNQPKPVLYGTMRVYPDLATSPYNEFEGSDQYAYQLFEVTQGYAEIDINTARFEDTNITDFDDYQIEVVYPGQNSTLFPSIVTLSSEVSNLQLTNFGLGPYTSNAVGTLATRLAVDIIAPNGVYNTDKESGKLKNYSIEYEAQQRTINDLDEPTSGWISLGVHTMSGDSRDAIRFTHSYDVPAGRYQVRLLRLTSESTNVRVSDSLNWGQLKAYIADTVPRDNTRIAVRLRASEQIGNRALTKFNVVAARRVPTWNSTTGWSVAPIQTNNPVWAFTDALRSNYGGNRSDAFIDLLTCEALAPQLDTENVEFNGIFDTKGTLWEALTNILMPARCRVIDKQGVYTIVRDSLQTVPVQLFTMRNIVENSFKIDLAGVLEETADSIRIEFFDASQDYRPAQFVATLNGGTTNTPRDVKLFGITDEQQAFNIAQWMNAQNFYRRQKITFSTGIEGRIPNYGDLIAIEHFMLGQKDATNNKSGEVVDFDDIDLLTLSEDVSAITTPYIIIRNFQGEPSGAWTCNIIGTNQVRVTDVGFDPSLIDFTAGYERPYFSMGSGVTFSTTAKVEKITPNGKGVIQIECFIDDPNVYTAADGLPVPPITQLPPLETVAPTITELTATPGGNSNVQTVALSWQGNNSDYYLIEYSTDLGITFLPAGTGRTANQFFEHTTDTPQVLQYRVAGVNILRGAWVTVQVDTNPDEYDQPNPPTNLVLSETFINDTLRVQWQSDTFTNRVELWEGGILRYSELVSGINFEFTQDQARQYGTTRAFEVRVYAVADNSRLSATFATLSVSNPAPALLNNLNILAVGGLVQIQFDYPTEQDFNGIRVWTSSTSGFTPSASNIAIDRSFDPILGIAVEFGETIYIRVAAMDGWDDTANISGQVSATGNEITVTQIDDNFIQTPMLAANIVTADKINVNEISAISEDIGIITAGTIRTSSGSGNRTELSSTGDYPLWVGSGTKNFANAKLAYDNTDNSLIARGITIYNDTGQVLLASGTGANQILNNETNGTLTTISRPEGANYTFDGGFIAGALRIHLPQSWSDTMLKFYVDIFEYDTGQSVTIEISGYNYLFGSTWINCTARLVAGSETTNYTVRFGYHNGFCIVQIGDYGTGWLYPKVTVKDLTASYLNYDIGLWDDGWNITMETTIPNSVHVTINDILGTASTIRDQGAFATESQITPANISTYIASLAVDTLYIAGNAVTVPSNSFSSATAIANEGAGFITLQSVVHVGVGAPVTMNFHAVVAAGNFGGQAGHYEIRILYNGVQVYITDAAVEGPDNFGNRPTYISMAYATSSVVGPAVFTVELRNLGFADFLYVQNRSITALETKK